MYFLFRENCHFEEKPGKIELFRITVISAMFHQLIVERTVIRKRSRPLLYTTFSIYLDEEIILVSAKSQGLFGEFDKWCPWQPWIFKLFFLLIWVISWSWSQNGWILAKFLFGMFLDRVGVEIHQHEKNKQKQTKKESNIQPCRLCFHLYHVQTCFKLSRSLRDDTTNRIY